MRPIPNLVAQRFGRLIVVGLAPRDGDGRARWMCRCDCGKDAIVANGELQKGHTRSCGCLRREDPVLRFMSHVSPEPNTGCWLWTSIDDGRGVYGRFWYGDRIIGAHRAAWLLFRGEIPPALDVLHRCDTPPCVNPAHLFLGTDQDNADDMKRKGRDRRIGRPPWKNRA